MRLAIGCVIALGLLSPLGAADRQALTFQGPNLSFELNQGQADPAVQFLATAGEHRIVLTHRAVTLISKSGAVSMKLAGGREKGQCTGVQPLPAKSNYLIGRDPSKWRRNVPTFAEARCDEVYPGVDVLYHGRRSLLEYDFLLHPEANAKRLRLKFEGARHVALARDGSLLVETGGGPIQFEKPVAYQDIDNARRPVEARYVLAGNQDVTFAIGTYDRSRPLVIDPVLSYQNDLYGAIARDSTGNIYMTGGFGTGLPTTPGVFQPGWHPGNCFAGSSTTVPCADAYVAKLDPSGTNLVYLTYLGGSSADVGSAIAVDSAGNAYVIGNTSSQDFPLTNAFQSKPTLGSMVFVTKLNPVGSSLIYSTLLSGNGANRGNAIAVDGAGNAYVTGYTDATDFPAMKAFQASLNGTTLFASFDSGGTWTAGRGLAASSVNLVVVDPSLPSTVFAGGSGGIFKSLDAGKTWTAMNTGLPASAVSDLAIDPKNSATLYAGISVTGTLGPGNIYKSTDGGATWHAIANGLQDPLNRYVVAVLVDPANSSIVYAGTRAGVYKSSDGGNTWNATALVKGPAWLPSFTFVDSLIIDPKSTSTIYALVEAGILKTTDGGQTWTAINPLDNTDLWNQLALDPVMPSILYATTRSGKLYKSTDGGATWADSGAGLPQIFVDSLAVDAVQDSNVYVGASIGVFASADGGANWRLAALPEGAIISLAARGGAVYAGLLGGLGPDAFVAKFSPAGALLFSTYLGGSGVDEARAIALDGAGNIYIAGVTDSTDFPTASAVQPGRAGKDDAFVTALKSDGSGLIYSTYLGGSDYDRAEGIAVDSQGNAYIAGTTISTDFPTLNAFQSHYAGGDVLAVANAPSNSGQQGDAFVTKLNAGGISLAFSTYFGGSKGEETAAIGLDGQNNVYIAGTTKSPDFPLVNAVQSSFGTGLLPSSAFLTKFDSTASALVYSTFVGGTGSGPGYLGVTGGARALAVTAGGTAWISGGTSATDISYAQRFLSGSPSAFLAQIRSDAAVVNAASFQGGSISPGEAISLFGEALASGTQTGTLPLGGQLLDTTVTIGGLPAALYYVSPGQLNVQVPPALTSGTAQLQVKRGGTLLADQQVTVMDAAPGLFVLDSSGNTAVLHGSNFEPVSPANPAVPGEVVSVFCVGLGAVMPALDAGAAASTPAPTTSNLPQVMVGGQAGTVQWSGLTPGYVGLYQINVAIPAGLPGGALPIQVTVNGIASNTARIAIQPSSP